MKPKTILKMFVIGFTYNNLLLSQMLELLRKQGKSKEEAYSIMGHKISRSRTRIEDDLALLGLAKTVQEKYIELYSPVYKCL